MKGIINTLLISAASVLLFSCEMKESYEAPMNEEIVLDLSSGITKAVVEDTSVESFVNHLDVFIFSDAAGTPSSAAHYGRYQVNGASRITLAAQRSSFQNNASYHIYVLANSNIAENDFRAILEAEGYDGVIAKKQEDELLHLTGLNVEGAPKYFLMDASLHNVQMNNGNPADNTVLSVTLRRAAAKVMIKIKAGENVEFKYFTVAQGSEGARYYIRNLPYNAFLFAEARNDDEVTAAVRNTSKEGDKHFSWDPEKDNKNVSLLTYVYPNSWSEGSILENETCVVMNLPMLFTPDGGAPVEYYNSWYKIHMTGEKVIRRNNYYEVNINLNRPGAISEITPVDVEDMRYTVEEWTSQNINVGGDDKPKYLMVNKSKMDMHNIAVDAKTLEFASSSPVTISVENIYYYDKFGQKKNVPATVSIKGTTDGGIAGNITVDSPVPTNNAIRYFTLVITNEDGLVERVDVTQYPLEYITNQQAYYSYRTDFKNTDDSPTTYQYKGDRYVSADWSNNKWTYSTRTGSEYFFTSKVADQNSDGTSDIYFYSYSQYGTSPSVGYNSINGLDNARMYHVNITSSSNTYVVGIPMQDADGYTDNSTENSKLVSPSFMIASQLGAVYASGGDTESNRNRARTHCKEYAETYVNEKGEVVHLTDWRLPTAAEIGIIVKFQTQSEVMDVVLGGRYYFCASGTVGTGISGNNDGYFLRCIRDVY